MDAHGTRGIAMPRDTETEGLKRASAHKSHKLQKCAWTFGAENKLRFYKFNALGPECPIKSAST
jgi:hypothetical protein